MKVLHPISIALCIFMISCGDKGSSFNPTAPTGVSQVSANSVDGNTSSTSSYSSCGNPNDWEPDDSLLQACLDQGGYINLNFGLPGYIVNGLNGDTTRGLIITRSNMVLTTSGGTVRIIAGRDLFATILQTRGNVNNFTITNISIDGMVDEMADDGPYRRRRDECLDGRAPGNVSLGGNGFHFVGNESKNAMCGSGLGLLGSGYEVRNNYISHNGRDKFSGGGGFPWADGITALLCDRGYIGHNTLVDNTDIDLVVGGGSNCIVEYNTIAHFGKYAFSGLNIGNFNGGNGNHSGSEYKNNTIYSEVPNRLGMGVSIGSHMWSTSVEVYHAGRVSSNTVYGANVNLVVDGVHGGEITGNILYDPTRLSQGEVCNRSGLNYTVYPPHVENTVLQDGWQDFQYDSGACNGGLRLRSRGSR